MQSTFLILLLALSLVLSACSSANRSRSSETSTVSAPAGASTERPAAAPGQAGSGASTINVSAAQTNAAAVERKIIRNAELTIESEAPEESFRKVASIAESRGGFVVTSESTRDDDSESQARVTV